MRKKLTAVLIAMVLVVAAILAFLAPLDNDVPERGVQNGTPAQPFSLTKKSEVSIETNTITPSSTEEKWPQSKVELSTEDILAQYFTPEQRKMLSESFHDGRKMDRDAKDRKARLQQEQLDQKWHLQRWYTQLFTQKPVNPVSSLKDIDCSRLEKITSSDGMDIGIIIGKLEPISDWLSWFENTEEYDGPAGMVAISILSGILMEKCIFSGEGLFESESKRVLAILDSFVTAWQDNTISVNAQCSLSNSLQSISPVAGGLEFIRKWTVENPFGDEALESNLVETLHYWPIEKSGAIAVEALKLARAGALKGATDNWLAAKRGYSGCIWTAEEVKKLLALPLGQAVKEATKMTGILYAELFAGDDLLAAQALEIGNALMARRDSIGASSYGFIFIRRDNIALSDSLWTEWFNSSDEYKIKAACTATNVGMGAVCRTDNVLDRMYSLAVDTSNSEGIRSAAAWPLSILDGSARALDLLESWLSEGESQSACLIAIGRIVVRAPEAKVVALLKRAIDEDSNSPAQRHYPLFLLATVAPDIALEYCNKDLPFTSKYEPLSILLSAATAQTQLTTADDNSDPRVDAIYKQLAMSEPDWIRAIRLNLDLVKGHTSEQRAASYPASRPK